MNALHRMTAAGLVLVASLATVLGLGWSQTASAHAALLGSDPKDGARVASLPARVDLEFSESMSAPAYIVVTAPDGTAIQKGEVKVDDADVSVALDDPGLAGAYTVAFRAVSADGHPVTGQFGFTVTGGGAATTDAASPSASPDAASSAPASAEPSGAAADSSSDASSEESDDDGGISTGEVQVGVGVALFAAAGGLFWLSRRQRG